MYNKVNETAGAFCSKCVLFSQMSKEKLFKKISDLEKEGSRLRFLGPSCYLHGCFLVRTHQNRACVYTLDSLLFIL